VSERPYGWRDSLGPTLALFGSAGTLVCCALPALLVSLGMGAAVAGLVTAVPQITWFSDHKPLVFGGSGALIALSAVMQWRARNGPCPVAPQQAAVCQRLRRISWGILGFAAVAWTVGFFFAFVAVHLTR
jgi:disulfide bond formation protein DsbB